MSPGIPQKVEAARKNECCEGVYAGRVQKHKSGACGNLQCFEPSFGSNSSVYRRPPWMLKDGRSRSQLQSRPAETILHLSELAVVSVTP